MMKDIEKLINWLEEIRNYSIYHWNTFDVDGYPNDDDYYEYIFDDIEYQDNFDKIIDLLKKIK